MTVPVHNVAGEVVGEIELAANVWGIEPHHAVMHQALVRQQANRRTGTATTLTRGEVRGGGRKPWRQKGTGRARQGSTRAPQWRGGGVAHGPRPRSYHQDMPKKMRRLAKRSVLSQKMIEAKVRVVSGLRELEPRTRALQGSLRALGVVRDDALVATDGPAGSVVRAGGNIPRVRVAHASSISIADLLKYEYLIIESSAVEGLEAVLLAGVGKKNRLRVPEAQTPAEDFIVTAAPPLVVAARESEASR